MSHQPIITTLHRLLLAAVLLAAASLGAQAQRPHATRADSARSTDALTADTLRAAQVSAPALRPQATLATLLQRIDRRAILTQGITDMGDALRRLAGVNVRDYGGAGGLKTVSVRSLGPSHTVVTYDGLPLTDTQQGQIDLQRFHTDRLDGIQLHTLDHAQLLCPARCVAAAVVDLLTAAPADTLARWHTQAALRQASWHTYAPSLATSGRLGRHSALSLSADHFFALNDYPFHVSNGAASQTLRRTNSRMQSFTTEASWRHRLPSIGATLEGKAFAHLSHRRLPGQVVLYVNSNDERQDDRNAFAQLRWQQQRGPWRVSTAARYNWQQLRYEDRDGQYPGGRLLQRYTQREAYATFALERRLAPHWAVASATDVAWAHLASNLATDRRVGRLTLLEALSLRWQLPRWQLTARALAQHAADHTSGPTASAPADASSQGTARTLRRITPSLTASLLLVQRAPLRLMARAGAKLTSRMPTFTESYYYHLGSTTLRPERTRQLSLGLTLQSTPQAAWWPLLALTADAYCNGVTDRIVSVPYNLQVWRTVNLGRTSATGTDLTLESRFRPAPRHCLLLTAAYSWQRAVVGRSESNFKRGAQLAYTPRHSGSASLAWQSPWLTLTAHTTWASRRWSTLEHMPTTLLPAFSEWGLSAHRTFRLGRTATLQARADLINAFNCRYELIRRYPMPGRAYSLSVKADF